MKYVYFQVRVSRTQRKSLPNFQVQIQKIKIHDLCYVLDWKTLASSVLVSLILAALDKNCRNETEMDTK